MTYRNAPVTPSTGNSGGPEDASIEQAVRELLQQQLTADMAVRIALLTSPQLQAMYESLGIAQADLVQAGLLRNPVLDVLVQSPREGGTDLLDFGLSWDFMHLLTRPLRQAVAEHEYEQARLRVIGAVMDLANSVRSLFYQAQSDAQIVAMYRQVVIATDAALDATRRLREAGNVTELALDQERVIYQGSRLRLSAAEAALMNSREQLNVLMGLWGSAIQWEIAEQLPELPKETARFDNVEKRAIESSIELAIRREQMEVTARKLGIVDVERFLPDLSVGYSWEREAGSGEWKDGPSIEFEIPIFDTGAARKQGLAARLRMQQREYVKMAIQIRSSARQAAMSIRQSYSVARHLGKVLLPLQQRVVYGTQLEYNAMLVGVFQLLLVQQQQINTGQQYIQALRDYWQTSARFDTLMNGRMIDTGMSTMTSVSDTGASAGGGH